MSDFKQQQERLLSELIRGQIDQATYQRKLAELQQRGAPPSAPPAALAPRQAAAATGADRPPPQVGLRSGATLAGQFRVREQLGRGGMGEVWRAYDTVGDRDVVIKILPPELQGNNEEMERVQQTFRRVHDLQHQHICPTHLLGQDTSVGYFLVMKYIPGVTLRQYWKTVVQRQGAFPFAAVTGILTPVAAALDYAHQKRIVHRDIKSENIMVSPDGRDPQIVDFGLAAEIKSSQARITQGKFEKGGTYPYMAPEQWRGQPQDGRTDQYALGCVAYELLAGRLPFHDRDPKVLRQAALTAPPPAVANLPPTVNHVLCRALAKDPAQRYETCSAFVQSLTAALAGVPQSAATGRPPPLASSGAYPALHGSETSSGSAGYTGNLPPPVSSAAGVGDTAPQTPLPTLRKPSLLFRLKMRLRRLLGALFGWPSPLVRWLGQLLPAPHTFPPWAWVALGIAAVVLLFVIGMALSGFNPFLGQRHDFAH